MSVIITLSSIAKVQSIQYSDRILKRAERALCCAPFQLKLFMSMREASVPLPLIADEIGVKQGYTRNIISEGRTERELMWLIQVGLLRREVDGQGITDSFRLTPLGRQLVEKWENQGDNFPFPSWCERISNLLTRWFRLPI